MSDTPRTDAACFAIVSNDPKSVVVWADFARQLERENAALQQQIAALGEIACLNLDDATVAKCDAVTGGEKYRDVMHRLFVEQPKELAALREKAERYRLVTLRQDAELAARIAHLLLEAVTDYELLGGTCDGVESEDYIARVKTALGETG